MSAVIVVHLIKIYTNHAPVESEAIPGKQSTGCQQNEGAETEDKNVRIEGSFFLLLHVEPSVGDYIVPHAPGFLVVHMGQRPRQHEN